MINLETKDFTNLLNDIYSIYAPDKKDGLDVLIAKYDNGYVNQRNAIQMAYILFNKPKNSNYNPEAGTEKYITMLMEQYARGERIISPQALKQEKDRELTEKQKKEQEELQRELLKKEKEERERLEALQDIKKQTKEQEEKLKELEELKKIVEEKESQTKVEKISSGSLFEDIMLECDIPISFPGGKDYLSTLCIGQRLVYKSDEGNIIGLEVEDINDDLFSSEKPIRIMKIKRV